jgi:hypothetical protein
MVHALKRPDLWERRIVEISVPLWDGEKAVHTLPAVTRYVLSRQHGARGLEGVEGSRRGQAIVKRHVELDRLCCSVLSEPHYLEHRGDFLARRDERTGSSGFVSDHDPINKTPTHPPGYL